MERWSRRVAVVTGASSGIGAAITEELVKQGLTVVGLARRVEKVEEMAKCLLLAAGKLHPHRCDIRSERSIKDAFSWIHSNLGRVDILINNAGASAENTLIDGPADSWKQIFDLNVLGLSICTKEALRIMKDEGVGDGHIININSSLGHNIPPAWSETLMMYSASKHSVTVLTEGLRRELVNSKSRIRVTSLSPGLVKTEAISEKMWKAMPCLEAQDIADAVVYVLGTPPHVQVHELTIIAVDHP